MEDAERVEGAGAAADVADAADAADVAGAPDAPPPGPFERLRTRTVVPFWIVGVVVLVAAFHLVARFLPLDAGEEQTFELVFGFAAYIAVGLWIVWACRRWGVGLARLVGALPEGHGWLAWGRLGLLLALTMAFSYGSWVLFANLLVGVAPWLLEFYIEALWVESDSGRGVPAGHGGDRRRAGTRLRRGVLSGRPGQPLGCAMGTARGGWWCRRLPSGCCTPIRWASGSWAWLRRSSTCRPAR